MFFFLFSPCSSFLVFSFPYAPPPHVPPPLKKKSYAKPIFNSTLFRLYPPSSFLVFCFVPLAYSSSIHRHPCNYYYNYYTFFLIPALPFCPRRSSRYCLFPNYEFLLFFCYLVSTIFAAHNQP